jgi:hypothetical protein
MKRLLLIVAGMVLAAGAAVLVIGPRTAPDPGADAVVAPEPGTEPASAAPVDPAPPEAPAIAEPAPEQVPEAAGDPPESPPAPPTSLPEDLAPEDGPSDEPYPPEASAPEPGSILPVGRNLFDDREAHALVWSFDTRTYAERFVEFVASRADSDLGLELVAGEGGAWQVRVPYLDEDDRDTRLAEIERVTGFDLSQGRR